MQLATHIECKLEVLSDASNNNSRQHEVSVLQVVTLLLDRRGCSTWVLARGLSVTYC